MKRKTGLLALVPVAALAAVAAAFAHASASAAPTAVRAAAAGPSCKTATIGFMGPITGPVASIGTDQLHWAQFFVDRWNASPKHKVKIKLVQGDTQLDPSKASVVAQQFASNSAMLATIGPAGSQEVIASSPILKRVGMAMISGSATRVSLTDGSLKGVFFRVVPNDGVQGPSDADYMLDKLGAKAGDEVMIVDDQEAYSTGLAEIVTKALEAKGVKVARESVSQKVTDFSSVVAKIGSKTKVVFLPWQVAANAQLFGQQMKEQGKKAILFGSDGTFDSSKFSIEGAIVSFFAPDVTTLPAAASIVNLFKAKYGETGPFGAPNWVGAQVAANAIAAGCKDGKVSRAEVAGLIAKTSLKGTLLGIPLSFTENGDVEGAKFFIFKIIGGKYVVQPQ